MKVLIVFENKNVDNLFVPILCRGLQAKGIDVEVSVEEFWTDDIFYDIIHFQWPEEITDGIISIPQKFNFLKKESHF